MFKKLAIRIGLAVLGMVAVLTWWTIHPGPAHTETRSKIPASVWGGGPTKITVEVESSSAAHMDITFSDHSKPAGEQQSLETRETMAAGSGPRSWSVDVPDKVGGYLEFEADSPKPGDWLKWRVSFNGKVIKEEKEVLDKALEPNTAFFLQLFFDDYSKALQEMQGNNPEPAASDEDN
jgi:hypothetical protein